MDFLDFEGEKLYFDEPVSVEVEELLIKASDAGREDGVEEILMKAYSLEPNHLMVLVALYRFYYYTQRYEKALVIADKAIKVSKTQLGLREDWRNMTANELGHGVLVSMGLTRFYLHALKASGFISLRMRNISAALERLNKLAELDPSDQFGASALINIAKKAHESIPDSGRDTRRIGAGL